ncbi:MAG: SRPBCC domain-containing protein [Bacteroidota bacterium]
MAIKTVGLTQAVGWEMGARKTFQISHEEAWDRFFSDRGLKIWLGNTKTKYQDWEPGIALSTKDGITAKLRVLKPYSHIRMAWQKPEWSNESTLQIRVMPSKDKAVVSFHHEKLKNSRQRAEMMAHWQVVLEKLDELFQ